MRDKRAKREMSRRKKRVGEREREKKGGDRLRHEDTKSTEKCKKKDGGQKGHSSEVKKK